ncbi:hypothetical protein KIH39_05720 [Telmatocola sphagniphila]|uniref:Uncharacterized protein n=1 Tax=Telmatocola sphagniphila TaxID=1123043 RepID=A0A8E6B940_9BACT|nr:hypothetical protein [Telmatocola sphagniphila]QVL33411.1 hypothetical protein KIH39_05720 [Telmatocola sphagniphila]
MSKNLKRKLTNIGLLAAIAFVVCSALGLALKQRPAFYEAAYIPDGEIRNQQSKECQRKASDLWSMFGSGDPVWGDKFTNANINSYLQEDFETVGGEKNLPDGFSEPRISFEEGSLRLGCRYGKGFWSTIISINLKVWMVANEVNTIGIEIVSLKSGSIGISPRFLLDQISELARKWNADLVWYRRNGNPVAVVKLQASQMRPTFHIQQLQIKNNELVLYGHSAANGSRVAQLP